MYVPTETLAPLIMPIWDGEPKHLSVPAETEANARECKTCFCASMAMLSETTVTSGWIDLHYDVLETEEDEEEDGEMQRGDLGDCLSGTGAEPYCHTYCLISQSFHAENGATRTKHGLPKKLHPTPRRRH